MYKSCKVGEAKRDEIRLSYKDGIIMGDEEKRMKLILSCRMMRKRTKFANYMRMEFSWRMKKKR
jgi:hypothetical protein